MTNIAKSLQQLEDINPANEYAYEEALFILNSIQHLPVLYMEIPAGLKLYRTRANSETLFEKVSDVFIPPNEFVTSFARCNRPNQSIFYGSESRFTSFAELAGYWAITKEIGETLKITVGQWVTTHPLNVIIVTTPDKDKRVSEFDKAHGKILDELLEREDAPKREAAIAFYRYMFEKFRKPAKDDQKTYIITSAYSNYTLTKTKGTTNGIYYPSVPFGAQGVNFALNIETANNLLRLKSFLYSEYLISNNNEGKHSFAEVNQKYTENIDAENNTIVWQI